MLQITSIVDVSMPKAKRERRGLDPHRPHMCVVNFTDGHTTLHGVEYQPISDMHALAAGAKVVIQRADIRGGYLLLDQHSFASVLFRGHLDAHLVRDTTNYAHYMRTYRVPSHCINTSADDAQTRPGDGHAGSSALHRAAHRITCQSRD